MKYLFKISTVILLFLFTACSSGTKSSIEGKYTKIEGNGGVFENSYLIIDKLSDKEYSVKGYSSSDILEWEEVAKKETDKKKITWTDKWLPMEVNFESDKAELLAGNGSVGKFTFKKTE